MEIRDRQVINEFTGSQYFKVPNKIMVNKALSPTSKLLYALIFNCCTKSDCFASNEYFCEMLNISDRQVQNCLKQLKENQCISIKFDKKARYISALVTYDIITPRNKNTDLSEFASKFGDFEVL